MKAELIQQLEALAKQESVLDLEDEFNQLTDEFDRIHGEEERAWELEKLDRIEAGEKPESLEKPNFEGIEEYRAIVNLFREKKNAEIRQIRDNEKKNLEQKKTLIAALKDLIQNEENIGRAINRFKDIKESWNEVGPIPRDKRQDIQKEYSGLVDTFQYNINIYKEIKDHDLKRNLDLKNEVITELKALLDITSIRDVENGLNTLQDKWNSIGGTNQEDWEKVKEEYWEVVNAIYDKIKGFYEERKVKQAENIEKKKALIEKAKSITSEEKDSHKAWKKTTDLILEIQEEWKTIGYGPKEENDAVWEEFRGICNAFFDEKQAFYNARKEEFNGIKEQKEALIEKVKELAQSTDWNITTKKIIAVQKEWKKLGNAGPKHENKLWKLFREPIDAFFAAKEAGFKEKEAEFAGNLSAKQELIEALKSYKPKADKKETIADLKKFAEDFKAIGNVPFKQKDEIYNAYKEALNAQYEAIDLDKKEKDKIMFQAKLDTLKGSNKSDDLLEKEERFIRKKISNLNNDLLQYENNMSFFANADANNPLLKNVTQNIENTKKEIEQLKGQLKLIRQASK